MPRLIRLYVTQVLVGFAISAVFIAGLLWLDIAGLRGLIARSDSALLAVFMLWFMNGIVFAGVQFAWEIMSLPRTTRRRAVAARCPTCARCRPGRKRPHSGADPGSSGGMRREPPSIDRAVRFPRTCIYRWAPGNQART